MKKFYRLLAVSLVIGLAFILFAACAAPVMEPEPADPVVDETPADTTDAEEAPPADVPDVDVDIDTMGFTEAPMLAEMVARGEIPPVHERLPIEPFISSAPEIGIFGGVYRGAGFGPTHGQLDTEAHRFVGLLRLEPDLVTMRPFLIRDWTVNDDFTVYTWYLREGLRWSDGELFTSADFSFWYNYILLNEELTPAIPARYIVDGQVMTMETPDDLTVVISFAAPNPAFDIVMLRSMFPGEKKWAARHYLEPFHVDHNPDAEANATAAGHENWVGYFTFRNNRTQSGTDVDAPALSPWILRRIDADGNRYFDRNPFYFVVDREGNQLPYIDQQVSVLVPDNQNRILRLMAGELHAAAENPLPVRDFTLYVEGETQGDYTVFLFDNTRGSDASVTFNLNHQDLVLREIFNDIRFRQAMSLAINRDMINEVLFFGRATVRQSAPPPPPNTSFVEDWMCNYMIDYDTQSANDLLDEVGLVWNSDQTQRMRPDGQPMFIVLETIEEFAPQAEMIAEMFTAVGVRSELRVQERALMRERFPTNERDAQVFTFDSATEFAMRANPDGIRPPWRSHEIGFAPLYYEWWQTGGASGLEPPQELQDLRDMVDRWIGLPPGTPEFVNLGREIAEIHTTNLWYIGTSVAPRVVIISNLLGNTPTEGTFAGDYGFWFPFRGDAWFFR